MPECCLACDELIPKGQAIHCKGEFVRDGQIIKTQVHPFHQKCFLDFPLFGNSRTCIVCRQNGGGSCCVCGRITTEKSDMPSEHWIKHHELEICELCSQPVLRNHMQHHRLTHCTGVEWVHCHLCNERVLENRIKAHTKRDCPGMSMSICPWCQMKMPTKDLLAHENFLCQASRCALCQDFSARKPCVYYKKCTHLLHSDCLGEWRQLFAKACPVCYLYDSKHAFLRAVGERTMCPFKSCELEYETPEDLFDHMELEHIGKICKNCGGDFILSAREAHLAFCLRREAVCPAFGCKVRVPASLVEESKIDAACLVVHHDCKKVYRCDMCDMYLRSVNKFTRHIKTHANDTIMTNRSKRASFKRAMLDLDNLLSD